MWTALGVDSIKAMRCLRVGTSPFDARD